MLLADAACRRSSHPNNRLPQQWRNDSRRARNRLERMPSRSGRKCQSEAEHALGKRRAKAAATPKKLGHAVEHVGHVELYEVNADPVSNTPGLTPPRRNTTVLRPHGDAVHGSGLGDPTLRIPSPSGTPSLRLSAEDAGKRPKPMRSAGQFCRSTPTVKIVYSSRFVRVIPAQGTCLSSLYHPSFL